MRHFIAGTFAACFLFAAVGQVSAQTRRPRMSRANMPPGWKWPPDVAMRSTGDRCLTELNRRGIIYRRAHRNVGKIATPIVPATLEFGGVELVPTFRKPPFVMDCHLALVLHDYGPRLARAGFRQLRFSSIYYYRHARLGGGRTNMLSRHALGLAIDIYGVIMADGTGLSVERHYHTAEGAPLHLLERILSQAGDFRAVVTPGNDPHHRDHFHLSAKMSIHGSAPDRTVQVSELQPIKPRRRWWRRPLRRASPRNLPALRIPAQ